MNSNYQLNEFYAKEKMAGHRSAAQAHRLASQAANRNDSPLNPKHINGYVRVLVASLVNIFRRFGQDRVSTPSLDLTKSESATTF